MAIRLYDIAEQLEQLMAAAIDRETGEVLPELEDELDALTMERDEKVLSVVAYAKGCLAEAQAIEAESEKLKARAKMHRNHYDRLIAYAERHVPHGTKLSDARSEIGWRKSSAVEVDAGADLPDRFARVKTERSPDKEAIKAALKRGEKLSFARIVERIRMVVR